MSDLDITGRVVFDASQAEGALDGVSRKAGKFAVDMTQAGENAGKGLAKIGEIATANGEKFTRSEGSIINQIKRIVGEAAKAQPVLDKLGDIQFNIAAKGLDAAKFAPYLDVVKSVSKEAQDSVNALAAASAKASTAATGSLNKIGISAAQTANALRGVPAQFTDIVTSLQGGQAPLTVFLQQGGQLKDMFGGAGNAARALGGYVLGLVNPFTVAAAAIGALGFGYYKGAQESKDFNKALIETNGAAGISAIGLTNMAQSLKSIGATQGAASGALLEFVKAGNVGADSLEKFTASAIRLESVGGAAVADTAKQFSELGKDPLKASLKLNESTGFLTQALYEQIKALQDRGDIIGAVKLVQEEFAKSLDANSSGMQANLGLIEKSWIAIKREIFAAGDALKSIGRDKSMADLAAQIANAEATGASDAEKANLNAQYDALKKIADTQTGIAGEKAKQTEAQKKAIEATDALTKANEKALTKQQQMNKALEEYRANLEKVRAVNAGSPLLDPAQVSKAEAAIRDQFRERGGVGAKAENAYASLIASIQGKIEAEKLELASGAAISESQKIRIKLDQDMAAGRVKLTQSAEKNVRAALDELSASEASALAKKAIEKADVSAAAARQKYLTSLDSGLDKIQADTQAQIESAARLGLSKNAIAALDSAKLEMLATDLELQAIKSLDKNLDEETYNALKKQAEAYRDLAKAKQGKAAKETSIDMEKASTEAAKKAEAEWQKTADSINNSLTDALLRGFESGKDFAANLRDTVVNMFKTLVLRPIISAVVNPVAGALTGALGLGGPASAATGGGGFASSASTLSSLFTTGSSFITTATNAIGSTYSALTGAAASNIIGSTAASGLAATAGGTAIGGAAGIGSGTALGGGAATAAGGGALGAIGSAAPYIAAAALLYEAMQYKVESKGGGIVANLGGGGDVARYNEFQQTGGLFGGGTTINRDWSKAEQGLSDFVNNSVKAITDVNKSYAGAIGLTSDSITDFTKSVEINLNGLDAAAQQAAIAKELQAFSNEQIAAAFGATLSEFANAGETTSQTLQRLGDDLAGANSALGSLGYALYDVSVAGASAASSLVSAFGNLQNFQAQMAGVMQNYYTQDEQRASAVSGAYGALTGAGITQFSEADIAGASREQIRAVIDQYASARGTAEGDKQYAAIVSVANAITKFVPDFEKANAAPQQQQQSSSGGGGGGGGRSESTVDPWKSAADAIVGAIKDLQNSLLETGPDSFARLQAQYAIDVAKAKAGDVEAATGLPDLAKSVANAAKDYGQTSLEQAMLIGSLIDSMADVVKSRGITVPGFASGGMHSGGWAVVGEQGPELVNMGPSRIYTAADTQNMLGGNSAELVAEIRALREEVATLRYSSEATATATRQTAKTLDNAANGGQPLGTMVMT